jgi:DNA invertase Pin-like site-specific DNA recombinase
MKNVIELIRVSTEHQAGIDRAGIPSQHEINKRTAANYGLRIVRSIEIVDVSGAAVINSPEMHELLRIMESPDIDGVVAKEFSRLIRPEKFTDYALLQHFIETNTVLYLPDGPIDLTSKTGRFVGTIRAAVAGMERREIIERMQDAKESMRRAGKHPGGATSLPYGVDYSNKTGWHYTAESAKVKEAFALFLSGDTSYTNIALRLNIPRTNVRFILQNPIYAGWRVYREKRDPSPAGYVARPNGRQGYRRKVMRLPDEVIRVQVLDGLVTEREFQSVQKIIELKREKHWRVRSDTIHRYTYNGFLVCGDCGNPLYTHTSKREFYLCKSRHVRERRRREIDSVGVCSNRYMLRDKLEPKIDHLLGDRLRDPSFLKPILDAYNDSGNSPALDPIDPTTISAKLETLKGKRHRILSAFFEGVIDKFERDAKLTEVDRERIIYHELFSTPTKVSVPLSVQDVCSCIEPFADWEYLEREDKRSLLAAICPQISVFQYKINSIALHRPLYTLDGNDDGRSKTAASPSRAPRCRSRFRRASCSLPQ